MNTLSYLAVPGVWERMILGIMYSVILYAVYCIVYTVYCHVWVDKNKARLETDVSRGVLFISLHPFSCAAGDGGVGV